MPTDTVNRRRGSCSNGALRARVVRAWLGLQRIETRVRGSDGAETDLAIDQSVLPREHRISTYFQDTFPPVARFRLRNKRAVLGYGLYVAGQVRLALHTTPATQESHPNCLRQSNVMAASRLLAAQGQ